MIVFLPSVAALLWDSRVSSSSAVACFRITTRLYTHIIPIGKYRKYSRNAGYSKTSQSGEVDFVCLGSGSWVATTRALLIAIGFGGQYTIHILREPPQ